MTVRGGSLMAPEVLDAMNEASTCFVDMEELNLAAGKVVARACGAEGGLVTASCAASQVLMVAACMTGTDPMSIEMLPDTKGLRDEVLMFKGQRNHYDSMFELSGGNIVEYGGVKGAEPYQLEAAITDRTCCVAVVNGPFIPVGLHIDEIIRIAHARNVPVVLDAAAEVPPIANLTSFIDQGVDMVAFSGGKGIRGPQNTGLLAGSAELVQAAYENMISFGKPRAGVGRPLKVSKENIVGLVTAIELFLDIDQEAVWADWRRRGGYIFDRLKGIPHLRIVMEDGDPNRAGPQPVIYFEPGWDGPKADEIRQLLEAGDPPIYVGNGGYRDELNIVMVNVQPGEEVIIADRLEEILRR